MKKNAPTMKDVAEDAGVALSTVSKYYSGGPVGDQYRLRVEESARKLGYQVTHYTKANRQKTSKTIAVILPNLKHPFFSALADELTDALAKHNCRPQLYFSGIDWENEQDCIDRIQQDNVDGVIGLISNTGMILDLSVPLVTVDCRFGEGIPCIASDNYNGGQMAAEKLIELGCRKLAFLRTGSKIHSEVDKRGDGFEAACRLRKVSCEVCWLNETDDLRYFEAFFRSHIKGNHLELDGIACSTDLLAVRMEQMLNKMGFHVPEDVQVIGYDGIRSFGTDELVCSTIVQPIDLIAETCVDVLLNPKQHQFSSLICLPVHYAAGGTTKEPRE